MIGVEARGHGLHDTAEGRTWFTDFVITEELRADWRRYPQHWRGLARDRARRDLGGKPDVIRLQHSYVFPAALRVMAFRGAAAGRLGKSMRHYRKMLKEAYGR